MSEAGADVKYVLYEFSRPAHIRQAIERAPVAWVPFGALEWHGEHNPLGLDGLKAHELVKRAAARAGGVVFPPVYWGAIHTMGFPFTFSFPPRLIKKQTRVMLEQLYGMGFKVVVMLTGHYPPQQTKMLYKAARRFNNTYRDAFALGIPEQALATDLGYYGDHAAMWETSLMMALLPELVELDELPLGLSYLDQCRKHGVVGVNPHGNASAEKGRAVAEVIVERLSVAVMQVLEQNSAEPFNKILGDFGRGMKRVYNIKSGKKVLGASSLSELIRLGLWSLRGGRQVP